MNAGNSRSWMRLVWVLALVSMLAVGVVGQASAASIIYVKYNATGANNGTSWANAYKSLQTALSHASSGKQIWVAKGTYKPTTGTNRTISFTLKNGVAIYGGFAGTETSLSQRKITVNVTILSGNIGSGSTAADNTYNVVTGGGTNNTAILDGFTITGGNANLSPFPTDSGGGLMNLLSSPTLRNLIVRGNHALHGGGMFSDGGAARLTSVTFSGNTADQDGGGMSNIFGSNAILTNVTFSGNHTTGGSGGGGMFNYASSPKLVRITFKGNGSTNYGGGMFNDNGGNPKLTNVTFSANTAGLGSGGGGMYNYQSNPTLTNVTFSGNSVPSGVGGGMGNDGSGPTLLNVTFSGNKAGTYGGGVYNINLSSTPHLKNVTFNANSAATSGGAIFNDVNSHPLIEDAILWGDGTEVINSLSAATATDSVVQGGCPASTVCTNVGSSDPKLGPLQNNGGFTKTMALGRGSAAIDAGGALTTCAATDQRGVKRPQGAACDIGAYEVKALTFISQGPNDGQVLESGHGSNVGGNLNSTNDVLHVGDDASSRRYRGFLSFNTAALPDGATTVFATVRIRQQTTPTGNPFGSQGSLLADLAKPYFGPSLALAASDFQAAATVSPTGSFSQDSSTYYTVLGISGLNAINKTGTTQFRLRFSHGDSDHQADYLTLYSGDTATASNRPYMIVYYNP